MKRPVRIHELEQSANHIVVAVDPHDGTCHGAHDIIVEGTRTGLGPHVTFTWKPSALLSAGGTREFRNALDRALEMGEELRLRLK